MKIAIVSGLYGVLPPDVPKQSIPCDTIFFNEQNTKDFCRQDLGGRLTSRFPKILTHELLPDHDLYIWVDAGARCSPDFAKWVVETLGDNDVLAMKHWHRNTIKEEADFVAAEVAGGDTKFVERYGGQPVQAEVAHYIRRGYVDNRLFANGMFAKRNTERVNRAMDEWWGLVTRWGNLCQLSFPYALRDLSVVEVEHFPRYDLWYGDHNGAAWVGPHHAC